MNSYPHLSPKVWPHEESILSWNFHYPILRPQKYYHSIQIVLFKVFQLFHSKSCWHTITLHHFFPLTNRIPIIEAQKYFQCYSHLFPQYQTIILGYSDEHFINKHSMIQFVFLDAMLVHFICQICPKLARNLKIP